MPELFDFFRLLVQRVIDGRYVAHPSWEQMRSRVEDLMQM
jgi:hypothetical protein